MRRMLRVDSIPSPIATVVVTAEFSLSFMAPPRVGPRLSRPLLPKPFNFSPVKDSAVR